jgi:hypothetical protein
MEDLLAGVLARAAYLLAGALMLRLIFLCRVGWSAILLAAPGAGPTGNARGDVTAAERHAPGRPDRAVPDTRPGRTPASTFPQARGMHGNGLRSRERRFESCRGHCSEV